MCTVRAFSCATLVSSLVFEVCFFKSGFSSLTCSKTANRNVNVNQDDAMMLLANKMLVPYI